MDGLVFGLGRYKYVSYLDRRVMNGEFTNTMSDFIKFNH